VTRSLIDGEYRIEAGPRALWEAEIEEESRREAEEDDRWYAEQNGED
jgi:hypothetical protein